MKNSSAMIRAGFAALLIACAPLASAQDKPTAPKKERKSTGTISEGTYRQLERIQDLIAKSKNAEALEKANALLERVSGAYEKAIISQTVGFIYASQNNYKGALRAFEDALAIEALPQQPYEELMFNVGQMYYADGQPEKAIAKIEQYMREAMGTIKPEANIMLASLYAEKKRFKEALPQVEQAIAKVQNPKEAWLQLKLALHYELKQIPQCAEVLVRLISIVPVKEDYWKQLHSILFEIKQDQDALAVLALAERQGFIDQENEVKNLANVYMLLDIPFKAGEVLQSGLDRKILKADEKTLSQLGDAWTLAREYTKAEPVIKQAAALSDKGDLYYRLGQIYAEDEKWKACLEMVDKALAKGVKDPGDANFLAGVAAYNIGDRKRALSALQNALSYDDMRANATQWIAHIRQEEESAAEVARVAAEAKEAAAAEKEAGKSAPN